MYEKSNKNCNYTDVFYEKVVQPEYKMVQVANDDLVGREDAYDAYIELL